MEVFLDCLPCILRQVVEASRMATDNPHVQKKIMDEALEVLRTYSIYESSPAIVRDVHTIVKALTGNADPYSGVKQSDLQTALNIMPALKKRLQSKENRLYWALKAAATGNVLDSAIDAQYDASRIHAEFEKPFAVCDEAAIRERLRDAKTLLVIGDNTGETVFDCLLLEQLPNVTIHYAVRNEPVINDTTAKEALASGIGQYAEIVSTGCNAPGVILSECSQTFLDIFHAADIVISKGQGNFETLSDCGRDIFFLLKAKCPVIAGVLAVQQNDYILQYSKGEKTGT